MEVFFLKVTLISGDFQWPLDVHGFVAVRDSLDNKRNYLFRRGRDNCQACNMTRLLPSFGLLFSISHFIIRLLLLIDAPSLY